ncbi:MAG: hypothetical protein MUE57_06320 [Syntrophales bacterium]|jgi:hypothetical protein|nr:hypothetical protein [Syntrophales bacterium]MCU0554399.1 hypothetical protein [Syntrophales bacterium]MCU0583438.1 hypothetical protein [Syntrophales bacterium]
MEKPRDFSVIVGDFNDGFVEIVAEAVAGALDPGQRLFVQGTPEADRILAMADERPVDLFVLFLNNVTFGQWGRELEADSFVKALMLVRHLKSLHRGPVITTAAFPAEFLYEDIALRVGADRFFRMPFEVDVFAEAVRALFPDRARRATDPRPAPLSALRAGSPGFNA